MRILYVTEDLANGGSERVISVLANGTSLENEAAIVAIRQDKVVYHLEQTVQYYPFTNLNSNKIKRVIDRISLLKNAIRDFKPDVVVAFDVVPVCYASMVCRMTHTKLVVSERADPRNHTEKGLLGKVYFSAFRKADGVVFQTADAKAYFDKNVQEKSTIIPNPINDQFIRERYLGDKENKIVSVCRLTKQKNLKLFIDIVSCVCHEYPEYKSVIFGTGPELENLKKYTKELGASSLIEFAGHTDNVADSIMKSKFYLCTSDFEGISNSLLEAMTLGLTVISTDHPVGGARMAITSGENGMLFPVGDKMAAVTILRDLIQNEAKAEKLGQAAIDIKNRWGKEKILKQWLEYLDKVQR